MFSPFQLRALSIRWRGHGAKKMISSVVQSRPSILLVFPFWSTFRKGPKRLTFDFQILGTTESPTMATHPKNSAIRHHRPVKLRARLGPWTRDISFAKRRMHGQMDQKTRKNPPVAMDTPLPWGICTHTHTNICIYIYVYIYIYTLIYHGHIKWENEH